MISQTKSKYQGLIEIILILVIAGCAYLPNLNKASIYRDDWYYTLDRMIGGPGVFQEMFSIDRPARGPLFELIYNAFDVQPLPYHISSFAWRVLGGFAALYLFKLLWPNQKQAALFMAILFMLFPGYSRWLEGFENQPRIISSFLEALSIALTLKAIRTTRLIPKTLTWTVSIVTGWAYIAFVDFSIGMEFFRILCVFLLVSHNTPGASFFKKSLNSLKAWAVAASIPLGFLFWRLFIFHNQRPTTDINLQLSSLFESPLHTGLLWLVRLFQSTVNVAVLAWVMPTAQGLFNYRVSDITIGVLIAFLAVMALVFAEYLSHSNQANPQKNAEIVSDISQVEAIVIGLAGVIVGVLPVIMANRYATLGNYSHYALPASLASAAIIGGLVFSIKSYRIRLAFMSTLVLLSVLTHYTISLKITQEETIISNFWQQVVWRAPGIQAGTTLFVNYPSVDYGQDVDTVGGPANFLYFPKNTNQIPAIYQLSALEQGDSTSKDIIANPEKSFTFRYRTHESEVNYANLLVISQPTEESCVHVIDANQPRISTSDPYSISLVAPFSKIERVLLDAQAPKPAENIFGKEPKHNWCYYYQKAELALQKGDWAQAVILGDEAIQMEFHPNDAIEWMPFLQAYAYTRNTRKLGNLAKFFKQEPIDKKQVCLELHRMNEKSKISPEVLAEVDLAFCTE
ncbi:MAG: hypothetical protein NTW32_25820 [Chloroflexi bacterium]|nr:hypothetical protein [Chloroflexota bacterium]